MRMHAAWLLVLSVGCRYGGSFACETDAECRARGSVGRCELETGFCTFDDSTCPSGYRYAESAGGGLANACSSAAMSDANLGDANTFDPSTCPNAYNGALTGFPKAKYVLKPRVDGQRFYQQINACETPGMTATHAVIVDSPTKAAALLTFIGSNVPLVWVGLVQSPTATVVGGDWISMTGTPLDPNLWAGTDTEPDDVNANESDHAEQAGALGPMGLYDQPANTLLPIVCECDGLSTVDLAVQYVEATAD
jgi:hypothetical protein